MSVLNNFLIIFKITLNKNNIIILDFHENAFFFLQSLWCFLIYYNAKHKRDEITKEW